MMRLAVVAACLFATPVFAQQSVPPVAVLQAGLVGQWTGALGYRDYQSNKLFELPMKVEISAVADGVSFVRIASFDDGPQTGLVWITSATLYDPAKSTATTTTLRKGRAVEAATDMVSIVSYADPMHWVVRYERDGSDDDKPARVRTTETRDGDTVLSVKEVMPAAETAKGWQFRNQTRLARMTS